ncbi:MAG: hypothetical protein PW843_19735 [Azospirillaceae bacterium]|nr:hypothetical protein [Azospirillaceae bacterium]
MAFPFFGNRDNGKETPPDGASESKAEAFALPITALTTVDADPNGLGSDVIGSFTMAAAGQVAAMIGEDTRTFMQSMEQIYITATAKALAMVASQDPAKQAAGTLLLADITASQTATTTFATSTAVIANSFANI